MDHARSASMGKVTRAASNVALIFRIMTKAAETAVATTSPAENTRGGNSSTSNSQSSAVAKRATHRDGVRRQSTSDTRPATRLVQTPHCAVRAPISRHRSRVLTRASLSGLRPPSSLSAAGSPQLTLQVSTSSGLKLLRVNIHATPVSYFARGELIG